jgi:hypothetical protein
MRKHGQSHTRLYRVWWCMHHRCKTKNHWGYKNYGGRGIKVCTEWKYFEPFQDWALSHGYTDELQLDRINNNKGYSPVNCRFTTPKENSNNRRDNLWITAFGDTKTISGWLDDSRCVVSRAVLRSRVVYYLWPTEKAITYPSRSLQNPSY